MVVAGLLAASTLQAQSIYGGLRGIVADDTGAAIQGAKVTLVNSGTSDSRATLSTSTGEYLFTQVVPGTYQISVEFDGFKRFTRSGLLVETQSQLTVDAKLEVGNVTESVQVTEEVPLVDTATASQGQNIDRQKLVDLPNLGRNPYMFSRLAPNVQQVGNPAYARMQDQSGSSQISISGGPVRGNNYLLDGVPITDMNNRAIIIASLESVQEMKVQANTYDAEMGRSGGGMFNAYLKSGTNEYHGSGGFYIRQTDWLANDFFNNRAGRPVTDQPFRNYMFSFGGPVRIPKVYDGKNKTFFWAVWEGYRDTQANSGRTAVPTEREITGDFSQSLARAGGLQTIYDPLAALGSDGFRTPFAGNIIPASRINPVGRAIAATFPKPTDAAAFFGDLNLPYSARLPSVADQGTIKFDHKITSFWNASLSYLRYNSTEPGENWFPESISSPNQWLLDRKVDSTQFNNTLTLNPTTVLAVRYGFNRFPNLSYQHSQGFNVASLGFNNAFVRDIPSQTFPRVVFQALYPGTAMGTNSNSESIFHSKNLVASVAKFIGRHNMKFGADYRKIQVDGVSFGNSSGNFTFNDQFTRRNFAAGGTGGADLASLLLGAPAAADGFVPTKLFQFVNYYSMFVQDDIRISPKLTLNLGMRWERETGLQERNNNLITGFDPNAVNPLTQLSGVNTLGAVQFAGLNGAPTSTGNPNLNKFSPRIGAAYRLSEKTTIRGGYGIFWAPMFALGGPYQSEGVNASTQPAGTNDGGRTPAINLTNPFPSGLEKPVGSSLGGLTGVGKSLTLFDRDGRSPMVQQFSIDIQRELAGGIAMAVGYVGSRSRNLTLNAASPNINQVNPSFASLGVAGLTARVANPYAGKGGSGVIAASQVARSQFVRPYPAFGNLSLMASDLNGFATARYDSLVVKAQKRMSKGLTFLAAWTFSKNFDASSGGAGNNLNSGNVGPQNIYDYASEYGLSYADAPHRISVGYTYELPFGKGRAFLTNANWVTDFFLGGWSMNGAAVFNSGFPLQIRQDVNNNSSLLFTSSQRPFATGVTPETTGGASARLDNWLDRAAFSSAAALQFGNVSRTINVRGPDQRNWDFSLFKTFKIAERYNAQFRAEALNFTNTPMFRAPNTAFGNASFGRISSQANFARFIQLGVRFFF